jgi:hypothetical protein
MPDAQAGDKLYRQFVERAKRRRQQPALPARVLVDYDPSGDLHKIKARLFAINFAERAEPPELAC